MKRAISHAIVAATLVALLTAATFYPWVVWGVVMLSTLGGIFAILLFGFVRHAYLPAVAAIHRLFCDVTPADGGENGT